MSLFLQVEDFCRSAAGEEQEIGGRKACQSIGLNRHYTLEGTRFNTRIKFVINMENNSNAYNR